jgi:hypothetical protein
LDVLPEKLGELPDSDQYVSIEVIQPGERSDQRALLSVYRFNKLAASGDMNSVLMNAVAEQQPQRPARPRRRGRERGTGDGQARGKGKVEWGLPIASWSGRRRPWPRGLPAWTCLAVVGPTTLGLGRDAAHSGVEGSRALPMPKRARPGVGVARSPNGGSTPSWPTHQPPPSWSHS